MRVLVPFAVDSPKTRLRSVLSDAERPAFAAAMLVDVVTSVRTADHTPVTLATAPLSGDRLDRIARGCHDAELATELRSALAGIEPTVDDRPLTAAVNAALEETPTAVVMSDLPLVTPELVGRFLRADGDVVVAPGRGGGTNALLVRHPDFRVDYHGTSYLDHLALARRIGATVREFDSHRLSTDVDEPEDLAEVLSLSDGFAREWLRTAGFELAVDEGRAGVRRG